MPLVQYFSWDQDYLKRYQKNLNINNSMDIFTIS